MTQPLNDYFEALERLKKNESKVVQPGTKITNDSVALEAGRQKGSIKKSRAVFSDLILAIDEASTQQSQLLNKSEGKIEKAKEDVAYYKKALEESIAREVSLLNEVFELKKQLSQINGSNVFPIKK
jgi:hypothetical protein